MGQMLGHGVRKTYASKGDDVTLTRFVKVEGHQHTKRQSLNKGLHISEGRTRYTRTVKRVDQLTGLLVSGHNNVKIGRDVRKAKFRGYWIYTLSLEERKTCPSSCRHWQTCYGNNMPFAKRIDHTDPEFLPALAREVADLCIRKAGVLIRLHALGDFFSEEYVGFWARMLRTYSNLAVFGYTARHPTTPIGNLVWGLNQRHPGRLHDPLFRWTIA